MYCTRHSPSPSLMVCLIIALLLFPNLLSAQKEIAMVNVPSDKNIRTLQRHVLGDSILLYYQGEAAFKLITSKTINTIRLPELEKANVIAVTQNDSSLFFYSVEGNKRKSVLKCLELKKASGVKSSLEYEIQLPDRILATHFKKDLIFVSLSASNDTLKFLQIRDGEVYKEDAFLIPINFFTRTNQIAFIDEGDVVTPHQAFVAFKIFRTDKEIVLTHDDFTIDNERTVLYRINLVTGENHTFFHSAAGLNGNFKSIWHNGLLYRITKSKTGMTISIYDDDKLVSTLNVGKHNPYSKRSGYVRDESAKRVFTNRTVWETINNTGFPFMTVHTNDSGKVVLKIGTHKISSGGVVVPLGLAPIAIAAAITTTIIINSMANDYYIEHYFYLKGNVGDGFTYCKETGLMDERIDRYEVYDPSNKVNYKYKSYNRNTDRTIGFYMHKNKKVLKVVEF